MNPPRTAPAAALPRPATAATPIRSQEDVDVHVGSVCFKKGPPGAVGAELEFVVADVGDPSLPVPLERTVAALAGVVPPGGSLLTFEPGGQVELSSPV